MKTALEYYDGGLKYPCTNESIPAVLSGLDCRYNDIIISIGGSGDIPFAIAPYVKKTYVVDNNLSQISFIKEQRNFLYDRNEEFYRKDFIGVNGEILFDVYPQDLKNREKYFKKNMEKIISGLNKIEIIKGDILNFSRNFDFGEYNKLYLSNALDYFVSPYSSEEQLLSYFKHLSKGGLVYDISKFLDNFNVFRVDHKRTENARKKEKSKNWNWSPVVYNKIV